MAIVFEKRVHGTVYYIYKFDSACYGVSITRRSGDTAMLPRFTTDLREAVRFVGFLRQRNVRPRALEDAAQEFRRTQRVCPATHWQEDRKTACTE